MNTSGVKHPILLLERSLGGKNKRETGKKIVTNREVKCELDIDRSTSILPLQTSRWAVK